MRYQEAEADEEEYWVEHPWARYKRDKMEWMRKKYNLDNLVFAGQGLGAPEFTDKGFKGAMRDRLEENKTAFELSVLLDDGMVDESQVDRDSKKSKSSSRIRN